MNIEFDSSRPIFVQLCWAIERDIITGKYCAGDRLPSVRELAQLFGVNPNTVQKSLILLEQRGIVSTIATSGRFVTADARIIERRRCELITEFADEFITKCSSFGVAAAEAAELVMQRSETAEKN